MSAATLIYRGPFQGSRLRFVVESTARAYGDVHLIWLVPTRSAYQDPDSGASLERLASNYAAITRADLIDGSSRALPRAIRELKGTISDNTAPTMCFGFSALWFGRAVARGPLTWCISGIPEESVMYEDSAKTRAAASLQWRLSRVGRKPDLVVTVSEPMSRLVGRRLGRIDSFEAPTCVDRGLFSPRVSRPRRYLTYLGTGAPWQGMDQLSRIWGELARRDPSLRFRIISRDDRTNVLATEIDENRVSRAGGSREEIAELLWEATAGFIVRTPHIVNDVSYPTKFAEYVAAGVPVVATHLGWDLSGVVRDTGCGILLDPSIDPASAAEAVLRMLDGEGELTAQGCNRAANLLDREAWVEKLASAMPQSRLGRESALAS